MNAKQNDGCLCVRGDNEQKKGHLLFIIFKILYYIFHFIRHKRNVLPQYIRQQLNGNYMRTRHEI